MHEIRRIWTTEEGDWQDSVPEIHHEITGSEIDWIQEDAPTSSRMDERILTEVCSEQGIPAGLMRELIDLQRRLQGLGRRHGVQHEIERILNKDWRDPAQVLQEMGWNQDENQDRLGHEEDTHET